jgi:hypothetical protein
MNERTENVYENKGPQLAAAALTWPGLTDGHSAARRDGREEFCGTIQRQQAAALQK